MGVSDKQDDGLGKSKPSPRTWRRRKKKYEHLEGFRALQGASAGYLPTYLGT